LYLGKTQKIPLKDAQPILSWISRRVSIAGFTPFVLGTLVSFDPIDERLYFWMYPSIGI
jgi:hypothetical protein